VVAAVKPAGEPAQTDAEPVILIVGTEVEPTATVIVFEVAVEGNAQVALEVITQPTTALLVSADVVNVALLVPASVPLTCHWYDGAVPPLVAVEENTTVWPLHMDVELACIVRPGATPGVIVIVTLLEVTLVVPAHALVDVNTQVTMSLLLNEDEAYELLLVPTLLPFTFHWYDGLVPGLLTTALNVTEVPWQAVVVLALIVMPGDTSVLTDMVTPLEVTDVGAAQLALDVSTQVTRSLLLSAFEL
jgi:hypothetical protein